MAPRIKASNAHAIDKWNHKERRGGTARQAAWIAIAALRALASLSLASQPRLADEMQRMARRRTRARKRATPPRQHASSTLIMNR